VIELLTPRQRELIAHLWEDVGWPEQARREGFCRRLIGRPHPRTIAEASMLIDALKSMARRGYSGRRAR
jgi:hypothetical protein